MGSDNNNNTSVSSTTNCCNDGACHVSHHTHHHDDTKSIRTFFHQLKTNGGGNGLIGMILMFSLGLLVGIGTVSAVKKYDPSSSMQLVRGGSTSSSAVQYKTSSSSTSTTSSLSEDCQTKLDRFERVWDDRRQVRVDIMNDATKQKKNVYDLLWRETIPPRSDPKYDKIKETDENHYEKYIFDLFEPEAVCVTEERFGGTNHHRRYDSFGDGPKFACGVDYLHDLYKDKKDNNNCLVYSIGSNNKIDFEVAVKEYIGCEIHTFDPTLSTPFVGDDYATFHPWGLGKDHAKVKFNDKSFSTKSLERIVKDLGHTNRKIDMFKIDCEGCEYDAMPPVFDAVAKGQLQIDQILIELHRKPDPYELFADFFGAADKAGYRITHKERNHWGCGGFGCIEYVFVSEDFLRRSTAAAIC